MSALLVEEKAADHIKRRDVKENKRGLSFLLCTKARIEIEGVNGVGWAMRSMMMSNEFALYSNGLLCHWVTRSRVIICVSGGGNLDRHKGRSGCELELVRPDQS